MKLYTVNGQSLREPRSWVGTQDEAKKGAKEIGGFWEPTEVPTDKPGLIAFLNGMEEPRVKVSVSIEDPVHEAEQAAIAAAQPAPVIVDHAKVERVSRDWDATDIQDFILNRATVAQAENIFQCLGTRFKEAVKQLSEGM